MIIMILPSPAWPSQVYHRTARLLLIRKFVKFFFAKLSKWNNRYQLRGLQVRLVVLVGCQVGGISVDNDITS